MFQSSNSWSNWCLGCVLESSSNSNDNKTNQDVTFHGKSWVTGSSNHDIVPTDDIDTYGTTKNHRRTDDIAKKFWKSDGISDDIGKLQKLKHNWKIQQNQQWHRITRHQKPKPGNPGNHEKINTTLTWHRICASFFPFPSRPMRRIASMGHHHHHVSANRGKKKTRQLDPISAICLWALATPPRNQKTWGITWGNPAPQKKKEWKHRWHRICAFIFPFPSRPMRRIASIIIIIIIIIIIVIIIIIMFAQIGGGKQQNSWIQFHQFVCEP